MSSLFEDVDIESADNETLDRLTERLDNQFTIDAMNERFAVVRISGKTRVVSMEPSPAYPGIMVPVYSTIADFIAFYANPKKVVTTDQGRKRTVGSGKWWIDHERRRQLDGIVFAPNEDTPGKLNLWTGYGCEPQIGDCTPFLNHMLHVICSGNEGHFNYLLGWMAYAVQNPGKQGEVAIVLRGKEGTGKGVLAKQFGQLFGSHFRHIANGKHLTGHFNAHLQNCSLLFADEAFFAGDRSHESVLKQLITEETILVEPKGVDSYQVRNCIHLIMASNSEWVVPAGADARRYFVLDVADDHKQDNDYFAKLVDQMDNGGREALLQYLLRMDLEEKGFNVRCVPQTMALADQKTRSRRGVDRLIELIAHDGVLPSADPTYQAVAITSGEGEHQGFYVRARALVPELKHDSSIVINNILRTQWGCESWKSGNRRGIRFPPLADLRARFDQRHGKQDWPPLSDWGEE